MGNCLQMLSRQQAVTAGSAAAVSPLSRHTCAARLDDAVSRLIRHDACGEPQRAAGSARSAPFQTEVQSASTSVSPEVGPYRGQLRSSFFGRWGTSYVLRAAALQLNGTFNVLAQHSAALQEAVAAFEQATARH